MDDSIVEYCVSCGESKTLRVSTTLTERSYTCETCGSVVRTDYLPGPFINLGV